VKRLSAVAVFAAILWQGAVALAVDEGFEGRFRGSMISTNGCAPHAHYVVRHLGPRTVTIREANARYTVVLRRIGGIWKGSDTSGGTTRTFRLDYHPTPDTASGTRKNVWDDGFCSGHLRLYR
jgi:hypothetical protein